MVRLADQSCVCVCVCVCVCEREREGSVIIGYVVPMNPGQLGPSHLGRVSSSSVLYKRWVDRCHVHVGVWIDRRYEYVEKDWLSA